MKKCLALVAVVAAMSAGVVRAEGIPSQSKLSQLGLASMDVVSDEQGDAVRGKFLGVGGILTLGPSISATPGGGVVTFPNIAAQTYISGKAPRPLGNSVFGLTGFATVDIATSATGNPTFSNYVNIPLTASVADVSGAAQISVQFFSLSLGN
jgi:hypothetical protein